MKTILTQLMLLVALAKTVYAADATSPQAIPFDQIGAEAQKQFHGEHNAIVPTATGAKLKAAMQRLEAEATDNGLCLTSTANEDTGTSSHFRVKAVSIGRELTVHNNVRLNDHGVVHFTGDAVAFVRPRLVEEYRVSTDGVRQDFMVLERPIGEGEPLVVDLNVVGARVEAAMYGVKLTLTATGRELAYSRLKVTDARGKELAARMEASDTTRLRVVVEDEQAMYPVRIDPTFSDADWFGMGGFAGAGNTVRAIAADQSGNLYIGGDFNSVGEVMANYVAKWNGSSWSALGSGMNRQVLALAVVNGELYAGGSFDIVDGMSISRVAKWNGSSWGALDLGVNGTVFAFAPSGNDLYVGGYFTSAGSTSANNIAKWNGNSWSALGSGVDADVRSLAINGGTLYAGGGFTTAGGGAASRIAKWDGASWSALGAGMDNDVEALALNGGDLYAGGRFNTAGGVSANCVAKWNGSAWSALPGLLPYSSVANIAFYNGELHAVGGIFLVSGGVGLVKWNGSSWVLAASINSSLFAVTVSGSDLYVGGAFIEVAGVPASRIARWNGTMWSALGAETGLGGEVYALATDGAILYAGGRFTTAGGVSANRIAKWDGSAWTPLGSGVDNDVLELAISGSDLYAVGRFTTAGGGSASRIAKWNGTTWSAMGAGMNDDVIALAVLGTSIYAGGVFTTAGGVSANRIAKWNGSAWSALGTGTDNAVMALTTSGSDLYVGGAFTTAGGAAANRIAKWDGSAWSALGTGMNSTVAALAISGSDLYAGGYFTTAGGITVNKIARWNGSAWSALGSGIGGDVYALAATPNGLYVGGYIGYVLPSFQAVHHLAKWDGSTWSPLGSGMDENGAVQALVAIGHVLYAGGNFTKAGDKASAYVAKAVFGLPIVSPGTTTSITSASAVINGTVNPNGAATTTQFEYGTTTSYGTTVPLTLTPNDGTTAQSVSTGLTGLVPSTVYHFRLTAANASGIRTSPDMTFTTAGLPDIVIENGATDIPDGGNLGFASVMCGESFGITLTLKNVGNADLTGFGVTIDGPDAATFSVSPSPSGTISGPTGSANFTVFFAPTSLGSKTAVLHIASNDPDENPFDINLSGTGIASNNAFLSNLTASFGAYAPGFNSSTYSYSVTLPFPVSTATLTPFSSNAYSTVTVNGTPVASGSASAAVPLSVGSNTITVVCTAQNGINTKTYSLNVTRNAPSAGDVELAFNPNANASVYALATQPDGKVLVGGNFTNIVSTARNYLVRLNADGTLDATFVPVVNAIVYCIAVQSDGKVLIGGQFSNVNSTSRSRIARINVDGTLDTTFNPGANGDVSVIALQSDGRILLGGSFSLAGGVGRNRIARLNADGTPDASFNPGANSSVFAITPQLNGKVLIGGLFTSIASTSRKRIARLNSDGSIDTSFDPNADGYVAGILEQSDEKLVVTGAFTTLAGTPCNRLARLNSDGTLDSAYNPNANGVVATAALQTDGKVVVGGYFSSLASTPRNFIARLNNNGSLDTSFNPNTNNNVYGLALQGDGEVLLGGDFTNIGGSIRNRVARLDSDAATQSLTVSDASRVQWLRGGASPEAQSVSFDLSTDGGTTWTPLGNGSRIVGGWELTGVSLPGNGEVRARARTVGGYFNGSSGIAQASISFALPLPEIGVEQPAGSNLSDGNSSIAFGTIVTGASSTAFTFTIKNLGTADLTGIAVTKHGVNPSDFTVNTSGLNSTITPNGSTTFAVTFIPMAAGTRTAAIHIASNDADENPFDITLTGTATAPEITVEQPVGNILVDGAAFIDYGGVLPGTPVTRSFRIKNDGTATLSGIAVTIDGANSADFVRTTTPAATLAPGSTTSFVVRFTPSAVGIRDAALHIASTDADENPFDISLTGEGLTASQDWEQQYFGTTTGTGDAAPSADPNGNGIPNLVEYALGGDPVGGATGQEILPDLGINPTSHCAEFSLTRYIDRNDITLTVQAADSLSGPWTDLARSINGAAFTVVTPGAVVNETGTGTTRTVTVCDIYATTNPAHPRRFMRLMVTQ